MAGVTYKPRFEFQKSVMPDAQKKVGGRQGALIRTIARRSLRKRKKVSEPGNPPTNREGLLKKFLFFAWDASEQAVFTGPEKLGKTGSVPHLLEHGGVATVGGKSVRYEARPTMQLALGEAMATLPELWGGAVN